MQTKIKNILLIYKESHKQAKELGSVISRWLENKGYNIVLIEAGKQNKEYKKKYNLIIVLGGDGTMLGVARNFVGKHVPLLGINFGKVGFLTEAQVTNWQEKLDNYLSGKIDIKKTLCLSWQIERNNKKIDSGYAINDVVISRGSLARLVCVDIKINDANIGLLRSDGLIISSSIGSSGYNISSGGPLISLDLEVMSLTPICPFLKTISPMIFDGNTIIKMVIEKGSTDCYLTSDGQEGQLLQTGDILTVCGIKDAVYLVFEDLLYFERLKARGLLS